MYSLTHETESIFKKLFVAIFINMAILLLMINASFDESDIPIISDVFYSGRYEDLNRKWYPRVGLAFLILVVSTVFSNIFSTALWEGIRYYRRAFKAKRMLLQIDMNQQMLGGIFEIDAKYSLTLAMIFM
jgi:hypothetical protein